MFDDNDRLQQMEDNFNGNDEYSEAVEYFIDDGYPQEMAEELASAMLIKTQIRPRYFQTQKETAKIQVYTAQLKMLTEIYEVIMQDGDTKANIKEYVKQKEKEIGYE